MTLLPTELMDTTLTGAAASAATLNLSTAVTFFIFTYLSSATAQAMLALPNSPFCTLGMLTVNIPFSFTPFAAETG